MTINRCFALFVILAGLVTTTAGAVMVEPPFKVEAKQAILIDLDTNTVLYEKNPDEEMSPSSMTKLMTGYLVFDALKRGDIKLDDMMPVSSRAWKMGGSQMFLEVGERVPVEQLIKGVIIVSGNDACVALAEGIAGSEEYFAELMTERAKELGMKNSQFLNSHGLHEDGHYSTARDLAILGQNIVEKFPEFYGYYSEDSFSYSVDIKSGKPITQYNPNPVLGVVAGADGMKTGFTDAGGYGLVASAKRGDRRLMMVINGLPSGRARAREAERMLEWGFRNFRSYDLFKAQQVLDDAPVWLGKTAKVPLVVEEDVRLTLSR
ncbi:MAG: D-alanyl-D-alanine carboxypeptidase, partial [Proteobacteria bacterium]|nr:D-alanyl-D-alanine carboxypeptidase [Pseudomonadota bacterium]